MLRKLFSIYIIILTLFVAKTGYSLNVDTRTDAEVNGDDGPFLIDHDTGKGYCSRAPRGPKITFPTGVVATLNSCDSLTLASTDIGVGGGAGAMTLTNGLQATITATGHVTETHTTTNTLTLTGTGTGSGTNTASKSLSSTFQETATMTGTWYQPVWPVIFTATGSVTGTSQGAPTANMPAYTRSFTTTVTSTITAANTVTDTGTTSLTNTASATVSATNTATATAGHSVHTITSALYGTFTYTAYSGVTGTYNIWSTFSATGTVTVTNSSLISDTVTATNSVTGTSTLEAIWSVALTNTTTNTTTDTTTKTETSIVVDLSQASTVGLRYPDIPGGDLFLSADVEGSASLRRIRKEGFVITVTPTVGTPAEVFSDSPPWIRVAGQEAAQQWISAGVVQFYIWGKTSSTAQLEVYLGICDYGDYSEALSVIDMAAVSLPLSWDIMKVSFLLDSGVALPSGQALCTKFTAVTQSGSPTVDIGAGDTPHFTKVNGPWIGGVE